MSSEQNLGYLQYIRAIILLSYVGIIISHYTDPYEPTSIKWNVMSHKGFERCSNDLF